MLALHVKTQQIKQWKGKVEKQEAYVWMHYQGRKESNVETKSDLTHTDITPLTTAYSVTKYTHGRSLCDDLILQPNSKYDGNWN